MPTKSTFSVFCTGSSGLVASAFKAHCQDKHIPFLGFDKSGEVVSVDILQPGPLETYIAQAKEKSLKQGYQPIVFHFAAITLTSANLTPEQEQLSQQVNVEGTTNVVKVCHTLNLPLVHISTDYVFSGGTKKEPYQPDDELCPNATVYAQTKAEAERVVTSAAPHQSVTIIRIAYPYGNVQHPKHGLLRKMLTWMENAEVRLYKDQQICPTPIRYIVQGCEKVASMLASNQLTSGLKLHLVGQPTTPYAFGCLVKAIFGKTAKLIKAPANPETSKNLVLDREFTESLLGIHAPEHKEEIERLKREFVW